MKRLLGFLACLLLLACASGGKAKILEPELQFVQITGPADAMYPSGDFEVQFGMRISNRSAEPITLERVLVETIGSGGPYRVPRDFYYMKQTIPGGQFGEVAFWARAEATGTQHSIDAQAPVTVRGTAYFRTPTGHIRKVFVQHLGQSGTGPR
jgi:hypothetical protein